MNPVRLLLLGTILFLSASWLRSADDASEQVLFDLSGDLRPEAVQLNAAEMRFTNNVACLMTKPMQSWPGVSLKAPGGSWDLSARAFVKLRVRNPGATAITVHLRVDNPGADGTKHCRTASANIEPGAEAVVRVDLKRTTDDKLDGKLFGLRGYPVKAGGSDTVDPTRINQVVIFLNQPKQEHVFELVSLTTGGSYTKPTAWTSDADPFLPLIDTYGQYRHKTWPGKLKSGEELAANRETEARQLPQDVASFNRTAAWDRYGGWTAGPKFEATGYFRVQKHDGKWWLVDPEGHLFWSHGIDCVRMTEVTVISEREAWFENPPPWQTPELAEFIGPSVNVLKGHFAGRSVKAYSFGAANLRRKYGPDWKTACADVIHQRLRAWGLNTIANWSDLSVAFLRRTPYTDNVGSRGVRLIEGSEGYWGKFPDVFDPALAQSLRRQMEAKRGKSAEDPWCLGYFSDNEMSWGDETSLALATLSSPPDQPAKVAFASDLRQKYGDVGALNAAWGTTYATWDALLQSVDKPDPKRAAEDLKGFYSRAAETYFRTVREAIKAVAPNQLYLGCRFAWVNARAARAAAKYCDVLSYNLYQRTIGDFRFNGDADVPLINGEFHFGALDRGMFHTGLVPVANQKERAAAYRAYVESALRHPQFVGTHWFQYQDQPTTGRALDEENYQIGFVDIADTPHPETVAASRAVGEGMYRLRLGR